MSQFSQYPRIFSGNITGSVVLPGIISASQSGVWSMRLQDGAGSAVNKGQSNMAGSLPVVIASDQSAIPSSQSGTWSVQNLDGVGNVLKSTVNALWTNIQGPYGQAAMTSSIPVVIASNQTEISISGTVAATQSGTWNITNISGTVSLPTGAATETTLAAASAKLPATLGQKAMSASLAVAIASDQSAITIAALTNSSIVKAQLQDNSGTAVTVGQKAMTSSLPVVLASDQSAIPVSQSGTWTVQPGNTANTTPWLITLSKSATSTLSNVASSASSVTLLASNANRLGAMFFNDSTQILYLKFGTTASSTSYTVQLASNAYYEIPGPYIHNGRIDGIWAAANGNCRVTEITA